MLPNLRKNDARYYEYFFKRTMDHKILLKYMVDVQESFDEDGKEIEWGDIYQMKKFRGGFLLYLWGGGPAGDLFSKDHTSYDWE